jgi:tRNA1(Val) A37 N6-methylase TrmN6
MTEEFNIKNTIIENKDCSRFTPKKDYECVFTCPPYFNQEKYLYENTSTNIYTNYNDWLNIWWRKTVKSSLKESVKYFAFVINNTYKEDMKKICLEEGLNFIEEIPLGKSKNHFQRVSKNSFKGDQILVFKTSF